MLIRALYWLANAYLVRKVQIKSWLWWTLRSLANEQIQHTCDAESRNQTWDTQVVCNHPYHCTRPPSCTLHGFNEIKTLFFLNRKSSNEASSGCYHGTLLDDAIERQRRPGPFDSVLQVVLGLIWTFLFCKNTIEGKLLNTLYPLQLNFMQWQSMRNHKFLNHLRPERFHWHWNSILWQLHLAYLMSKS